MLGREAGWLWRGLQLSMAYGSSISVNTVVSFPSTLDRVIIVPETAQPGKPSQTACARDENKDLYLSLLVSATVATVYLSHIPRYQLINATIIIKSVQYIFSIAAMCQVNT